MKKVDLVVIGAGPAGLASAYEARLNNKNVIVLEKTNSICATLLQFYKDGKRVDKAYKGLDGNNYGNVDFNDGTKESTIKTFEELIEKASLEIEFQSEVESVKIQNDSFLITSSKQSYECKNIIIAIGRMGKPNKPDYKLPASLSKVINFNANSVLANEKILVVGGGNSAAEYAVDLCENTELSLCYRKKEFTRLNDINLENLNKASLENKLTLKLGLDIKEVLDENSKVKVVFSDDSSCVYDRVIYAIGGSTPVDFLQKCGVKVDDKGIAFMDENRQSNVKGIFLAGDIASKNGASIVCALNDAYKINSILK